MKFRDFFQLVLTDLGVSPAEAARGIGVDPKTITNWLRRDDLPASDAMKKLVEFLLIPEQILSAVAQGAIEMPPHLAGKKNWLKRRAVMFLRRNEVTNADLVAFSGVDGQMDLELTGEIHPSIREMLYGVNGRYWYTLGTPARYAPCRIIPAHEQET